MGEEPGADILAGKETDFHFGKPLRESRSGKLHVTRQFIPDTGMSLLIAGN